MPNNKSDKLDTAIMPNYKSYRLNTTIMPNNEIVSVRERNP